jgi:uncharacterized membrane protein YsdA (DUF1294 family)
MMNQVYIFIYLIVANTGAFVLYGIDKRKAQKHLWRIPERTLIGIAIVGGSIGALLGMKVFHHKTKHVKFTIGVPLIIIIEAAVAFLFLKAGL